MTNATHHRAPGTASRLRPLASIALSAAAAFALLPTTPTPTLASPPSSSSSAAPITLIGRAAIPGKATDLSGLTDTLPDGTPHNRLGGFGSGIDFLGHNNLYVAINDRGPWDGATPYHCRFQTFEILIDPAGDPDPRARADDRAVRVRLVSTTMLTRGGVGGGGGGGGGQPLIGSAAAFDSADQTRQARFDPEGIRLSPTGTLWIAEEYGPYLDEFALTGEHLRRVTPPAHFTVAHPAHLAKEEMPPFNTSGRQPNRGFEGLAITPSGEKLFAVLQSPLIQDGALNEKNKRRGINTRILEVDFATGRTREFIYQMHDASHGISEILAYSETGLLILERDGGEGLAADFRRVYRADLTDGTHTATDVSSVNTLPASGLPPGVTPLRTTELLDFTLGAFGLNGESMPQKIEGLCFGPPLPPSAEFPNGRLTLIVTTDNDLQGKQPSWFWVFAVDPALLPGHTERAWPAE